MEKTTIGLLAALGAVAATPAIASAPAVTTDAVLNPKSVAELLDPIANPVETLHAVQAQQELAPVEVKEAQIYLGPDGVQIGHRHHHHHHHHYVYHHHHHHYHHHHHHFYNGY